MGDVRRLILAQLVWMAAVPVLFRVLGPKRAVLVGVFGGFLLLPALEHYSIVRGVLPLNKVTATGLGLLLGVVLFDRPTLRAFRPHAFNAPMIGLGLAPYLSLALNGGVNPSTPVLMSSEWVAGWGLIYLAGRLYFGDVAGTKRVAGAVVAAGLATVPLCAYETAVGPTWYLAGLLYGKSPNPVMVARLSGWRPELFLRGGLEVASWTAVSAVTAAWLLASRSGWKLPRVPVWLPAPVLIVTALACRGVYGYVTLAVGLSVGASMLLFRSRWPLVVLVGVSVVYIGVRLTGAWDGHELVEVAARLGRPDTVAYRLDAEARYVAKTDAHNLVFGFGGGDWGIYNWWTRSFLIPEGWWVLNLAMFGLFGMTAFLLAFFLVPTVLMADRLPDPSPRGTPAAAAWGLTLFLALHQFDMLHNQTFLTPTVLIGGALVSVEVNARKQGKPAGGLPRWTFPVLFLAAMVAVEAVGRRPKAPPPPGWRPLAGEVDR